MSTFDTQPGESSAHVISSIINLVCPQCGGGCRNSNVKGDAVEAGWQNGNGRIRPPGAPNRGEATLAGRCGELLYFGAFVLNASANAHNAESLPRQELDRCNGASRSVDIRSTT